MEFDKSLKWSKAVWIEDDDTCYSDTILTKWINLRKKEVYLPKYMKMDRAMSLDLDLDEKTFATHRLIKIKRQSDKRRECQKCADTETGDSESDEGGKRKLKPNSRFKDFYEQQDTEAETGKKRMLAADNDEESDDGQKKRKKNITINIPDLPQLSVKKTKPRANDESDADRTDTDKMTQKKRSDTFTPLAASTPSRKTVQEKSEENLSIDSKRSASSQNPCKDQFPLDDARFQRKMLHWMVQMSEKVDRLNDKVETLLSRQASVTPTESLVLTPAKDYKDFLEVENKLKDGAEKRLQAMLASIGGHTLEACVTRGLNKLMTIACMELFNMSGRKGKKAFADSKQYRALVDAVVQTQGVPEKAVHSIIANRLKMAPYTRMGSQKLPKKTITPQSDSSSTAIDKSNIIDKNDKNNIVESDSDASDF